MPFCICCFWFFFSFFFSSRRRHTRLQGDWSSDVCSSDLYRMLVRNSRREFLAAAAAATTSVAAAPDRKSTRLNSSHLGISYAVLCLKRRTEETAKVMTADGLCLTRDIGVMDEQGRVKIIDRKKDMIFFFNDTATTEIYTLSLHDALPISACNTNLQTSTKKVFHLNISTGYIRSEEHTSELQSPCNLVCRLLLEKKTR